MRSMLHSGRILLPLGHSATWPRSLSTGLSASLQKILSFAPVMPGVCNERCRNFAVAAIYNACVMNGAQAALQRSLKSLPFCAEQGEMVFTS